MNDINILLYMFFILSKGFKSLGVRETYKDRETTTDCYIDP